MAPVFEPPESARYVMGLAGVAENCEYHPESVVLSVQVLAVPVVERVSKFCVDATPIVVSETCARRGATARARADARPSRTRLRRMGRSLGVGVRLSGVRALGYY